MSHFPPGTDEPIGVIFPYVGSTAPSKWLIADGAAISRTVYNALFTAIGTSYGTGDGTTTFNLPDLRGRVPVGLDGSQAEFAALNSPGGEVAHRLRMDELPTHTHTQSAHTHTQTAHTHSANSHNHGQDAHGHGHNHNMRNKYTLVLSGSGVACSGAAICGSDNGDASPQYYNAIPGIASGSGYMGSVAITNHPSGWGVHPTTATNTANTGINQSTGGDVARNNLQPYLVVNYIILTGV
jgi:microcystin-dependent protein